ncbi:MAG: hypothetical protein A2X81_08540 [Desulfobacterales bacterium GWB2_56_26]|nr:MAG: hypothetical protein A2X81_08540 [Desulfobacterales bacterium GWB2_56_26]
MTRSISSLYFMTHDDAAARIARRIEAGCERATGQPQVFFRADDIGIPSRSFAGFIALFRKHSIPLCLATVPTWLNEKHLAELRLITGTAAGPSGQWCWHQHGYIHHNFELSGKKQEFGPAREPAELRKCLAQGRDRLLRLLGDDFCPVFTPPWNRCGEATLRALADLGFQAVSRSRGARPEAPAALPDFQVQADLHTRKEQSPELAFAALLNELEDSLASGRCGIMIHHQRMNARALQLLDILLGQIKNKRKLIPVHFGDLLKEVP